MKKIVDFLKGDRFAEENGIKLLEIKSGYAKTEMVIEERHLNGMKAAQGGAIFTLADLAFAAAANSHGVVTTGINVSISYTKAATLGDRLTAEAKEISRGRTIGTYMVNVTNAKGETVAIFQGMGFIKKDMAI
ncbi:MAG TPA: hotdog fold thioesterase [Candidatus Omnitrophota bacterium]|mgnify:CR=1 FL=1|nr:hotdog fold thioesterase [Candidatus Omnitrophota bacterium]HPS20882.1 hotdog fold thioesterase [Candidatus Omnitrophota bacterium]